MSISSPDAAAPRWLILMLSAACGLIVANLYYAQPLAGPIGMALGMRPESAGLIVTLTQLGYGAGLLLIVPLADLVENRRLVLMLIGLTVLALLGAGLSTHPLPFLLSSLFLGLGSVAVQVLVPYSSHLVPEAVRGRVVGSLLSGLMLGIMLARPVSSLVAEVASWHAIFFVSAITMLGVAAVLAWRMPVRVPAGGHRYGTLLRSMARLVRFTPVLRRRAAYQAGMFGAFSLFWTVIPLLLAGPDFRMSQGGIALFALAGVSGAVAAPIAGRVADRGWSRPATLGAMALAAAAFPLTHLVPLGGGPSLALLVVAAIALDFGATANLTLGQRALFVLGAEQRGRLNGVYMASFFMAGAAGSALGAWAYARGGWALASTIGFAMPALALAWGLTERGASEDG